MFGGFPNDDAIVTSDGEVWSYSRLRDEVAHHDGRVRSSRELLVGALARWQAGRPVVLAEAFPTAPLRPDAALVMQTSGSRGKKRLVVLGAEGLLANIEAMLSYLPVREFPRTAITMPLHYSFALVGQALVTLRAGGTIVLLHDVTHPTLQIEAMRRLGVNGYALVPTSLQTFAEAGSLPLGYIMTSGARLDVRVAHAMRQAFPDATLFNQYGLTEASCVTALSHDEPAFWRGSVGRALPGVSIQTIDGELYVDGPSLMLEYHGQPDATAAVLTPNGLRTGDLAEIDADGYLFVQGRNDDLVKLAGERVSLEEVARALRDEVDVIEVLAIEDENAQVRLVGAYVADSDRREALQARANAVLPSYKRPRRYVRFEGLPILPNGKVDVLRLREMVESE